MSILRGMKNVSALGILLTSQWIACDVLATPATEQPAANSSAKEKSSQLQPRYLRQGEFEVLGAGCASCLRKIEMDLRVMPGVELARGSLIVQPPVVTVVYDMDKVSLAKLIGKVESSGYTTRNQRDSFYKVEKTAPKSAGLFSLPDLKPF